MTLAKAGSCSTKKGGKERRLPAHQLVREALRAYLLAAALEPGADAPLLQTSPRHSPALSGLRMSRQNVWKMVKRRCEIAGLPDDICNHSFRATGITLHQESGGRLEEAQGLAGHADARTTRLYVRKNPRHLPSRGRAGAVVRGDHYSCVFTAAGQPGRRRLVAGRPS